MTVDPAQIPEFVSSRPAMYPKDFSRNEYGFSVDVLARLTRGKK